MDGSNKNEPGFSGRVDAEYFMVFIQKKKVWPQKSEKSMHRPAMREINAFMIIGPGASTH
jgi:hypothetical protein